MSLRRVSDIYQLPVLDLETGEMLGQILSWVVTPLQQRVVAFLLTKPTLWHKAKVLVPADIVEYDPKMIVVRNYECVIQPSEVVGLPELLDERMEITGFRAETETGKLLGTVTDFVFETVGSTIQQYCVKPPTLMGALQSEWILPAGKVVKIEKHRLVFADNILSATKLAARQQTQTI